MEIWKEVKGYENHYFVSNLGNVKTNNHYGSGRTAILKPAIDKNGYLRVALQKDLKLKTFKVHRLVAQHFILNTGNKPCVNHIDGIKKNNSVSNLEWCTQKENTKHAIDNGLFYFNTPKESINVTIKRGELNGCSILTEKQVLEIREKFKPRKYTREMLAIEYGVKPCTIKDIILKRSWKHI